MKTETQDKLKEIKRSFRLLMNGVASHSMREKGLGYGINWGIGIPVLKNIAKEYGQNYELAVELWKENIRECKILATMIMPPAEMSSDLVELWISQIPNQEMAELASFNIFCRVENAKDHALKWLSSGNGLEQICGYHTLSRLFLNGLTLTCRELNEYIDQAQAAIDSGNIPVSHAAVNSLSRFSAVNTDYLGILKTAFKNYNLDIF